jgi:hypothetical protein
MLPQVKSPANIGRRTVAVNVSGALSQTAVQGSQRTFRLELVADLSDLQQNITDLLRAQLDRSDNCGQRIAVRQASLAPSTPTSVLFVKLHFERWSCMGGSAAELAEGDGSVEIRLSASIENKVPKISAVFGRVDAGGMMGDALRTGSLGDYVRDGAEQLVLPGAQAGSNFDVALPPAIRHSATIQSARFQDFGVGGLSVVLGGQIEISNVQADQLASQLNQALSAEGTVGQGTPAP